jgi:hypothetical protein
LRAKVHIQFELHNYFEEQEFDDIRKYSGWIASAMASDGYGWASRPAYAYIVQLVCENFDCSFSFHKKRHALVVWLCIELVIQI